MKTAAPVYRTFISFEERAASIYLGFASRFSEKAELSSFWLEMGMQEKQHAGLLQFCLAENLFVGDIPNEATIAKIDEAFRSFEARAAAPELSLADAFQIAIEMEASEINDIYCHLTTSTHSSMYLWRRKVATLATDHVGLLLESARKFGVSEEIVSKLRELKDRCP